MELAFPSRMGSILAVSPILRRRATFVLVKGNGWLPLPGRDLRVSLTLLPAVS